MATVFSSHDQVAHAFATQSQDFGRSPFPTDGGRDGGVNCPRVRFIGRMFYSYSTPVARLEPIHGREALCLLVVPNEWGPATGQHIGMATSATRHLHDGRVYTVPHVGGSQGPMGRVNSVDARNAADFVTPTAVDHIGNVVYLREKYFAIVEACRNTRKKLPTVYNPAYDYMNPDAAPHTLPEVDALRETLRAAYAVAADYSEHFGPVPSDRKFPADFAAVERDVQEIISVRAAAAAKRAAKLTPAALARREAAKAEREAKAERLAGLRNATAHEKAAAWRDGLNVPTWQLPTTTAAFIRATGVKRDKAGAIIGGTLETSQGARVPLPEAVRVFRFLKCVREAGKGWRPNGLRGIQVGMFAVSHIEPNGDFVAGCHSFIWDEIKLLAEKLGVFDLPCDPTVAE